jgi:BASS family bile acid:Na+ symporter
MLSTLKRLVESYIFILCAAIAAGFLLPATKSLVPYNTLFLQAIFLISSLKLDLREVLRHGKDWKMLLAANVLMLVLTPLAVKLVAPTLAPEMAFALFLLAAMPAGMTAPLLVEVVGGKQALALVVTITSSLLAPLTIPLITKLAYGATVEVDTLAMFRNLLMVIFVPFLIAMVLKRLAPKAIEASNKRTKPVSLLLLGLLIASAIATRATDILGGLRNGTSLLWTLGGLYLFYSLHHVVGYYALWWKPRADRMTLSVCLTYVNFTLAIYLASRYFPEPQTILPLVLSILPWATLLPVCRAVANSRLLR